MASIGQTKPINLQGMTLGGVQAPKHNLDLKTPAEVTADKALALQQKYSPVAKPVAPINTTISTSEMTKTTPTTQVVDTSGLIKNIQNTLAKYTSEAGASDDFVKGAIKASEQVVTPELLAQYKGKKLGDVISGLGLGEKVGYTATPAPTISPEATKGAPTQAEWEKAGNTGVAPFSQANGAPPPTKTPVEELEDFKKNYSAMAGEQKDKSIEDTGFLEKSAEYETANAEYETAKNQLDAFNLGLVQQGIDIKAKPILLGDINEKLAALDDRSKVSAMFLASNANSALVKLNLSKGLYEDAKKIVQDSAPTWYEAQKLALDEFAMTNKLDQQQKDDLATKDTAEFNKMKEGYLKITTPADQTRYEQDILSGKADGTIQTDVYGQKWFKPKSTELSDIELYSQKKAIDALYEAGTISQKDAETAKNAIVNDQKSVEQANTALTFIDEILTDERLGAVTGFSANLPTLRPESVGLVQKIDSLKSLLSLQNLGYLKGAMSDKDLVFIQSASSALNRKMSEGDFKNEMAKIKTVMTRTKLKTGGYRELTDYFQELSTVEQQNIVNLKKSTGISDEDLLKELQTEARGFNSVGGDTNSAVLNKVVAKEDGTKGGQCGRFVNQITGLGLGDSYESKMAKMDSSITKPEPGMVFVYPYKNTGHTGFIVGVKGDKAIVKDSNFSLDEKVKTHEIALSKITGLRKV